MKKIQTAHIIGANHQAINTAIWLASAEKQVRVFAKKGKIDETLAHYKFDHHLNLLWTMYVSDHKIIPMQACDEQLAVAMNSELVWCFVDDCGDIGTTLIRYQSSPHSQIILSGTRPIGEIAQIAHQLKSQWVYYLPFIFMKDGANFGSFFSPNFLMIGEKMPNSTRQCGVLAWLQHKAKACEITDIKTIEFARSTLMAMLATRLSFMNEMARLADSEQINICHVQKIIGQDERIGSAYLAAGWGFGGQSLPKEIDLLSQQFSQNQVDTYLLNAVLMVNEDQKELTFRKFWQYFNGFIENKTVVIWGAGYRVGTSRITNSAIHVLLGLLWSYHIHTIVYANNTLFELQKLYGNNTLLQFTDDPYEALGKADGLFIINWSETVLPDVNELNKTCLPIFDAKNILSDEQISQYQGDYVGMGR